MNIIPYRIVLADGKVIRPEEIRCAETDINTGDSPTRIILYSGDIYKVWPDEIRLDLPTGMKDSTGKDMHQNDTAKYLDMNGIVKQEEGGEWLLVYVEDGYEYSRAIKHCNGITVTGMVPWEER